MSNIQYTLPVVNLTATKETHEAEIQRIIDALYQHAIDVAAGGDAPLYSTVQEGIDAGATLFRIQSADPLGLFDYYQVDAGIATLIGAMPSLAGIDLLISDLTTDVADLKYVVDRETIDYATLADLQADALITIGKIAHTQGYAAMGDGGGNTYEIVPAGTGTHDGGAYIDLAGSGLQARGLFPRGVFVDQFGLVADTLQREDGAMTSGSATLTSAGAAFAAGDVGKAVYVIGAGAAGGPLKTTITAVNSPTSVTLAAAAGTTVAAAHYEYGTDATAVVQAAVDYALPLGRLRVAADNAQIMIAGDVTLTDSGLAGNNGRFVFDATGSSMYGGGRIVLDAVKRSTLVGFDAQTLTLAMGGAYFCATEDCDFGTLRFGDPGFVGWSGVQSVGWAHFARSNFGIVWSTPDAGWVNAIRWSGGAIRSNPSQGFQRQHTHNLLLQSNDTHQNWVFDGTDFSEESTGIVNIQGTLGGDAEIKFDGCYFDHHAPEQVATPGVRIIVEGCHASNEMPYGRSLAAALSGNMTVLRVDRGVSTKAFAGQNLFPDGDFGSGTNNPTVGSFGGALLSTGGAALTMHRDDPDSMSGNYVQLASATGAIHTWEGRRMPHAAPVTYTMILRSNGVAQDIRFGFLDEGATDQFQTATIGTDWTVVSMTVEVPIPAGTKPRIRVFDPVSQTTGSYDVDICYVGAVMGRDAPLVVPSSYAQTFVNSTTWDPASVAAGATVVRTIAVTGAALGDFVDVSLSIPLGGLLLSGSVSAADTVLVTLYNPTAGAIDLASATLRARTHRIGAFA